MGPTDKPSEPKVAKRQCFVISPIGEDGSTARMRSNNVLDFIISPALERCGYDVPPIRADQMPSPGRITRQIIGQLLKVELVVADLTDHNPNVFYELAIRHASRKAVVQIIHIRDKLPFDVANQRTIFYDHEDLRAASRAIDELSRQIDAAQKNPESVDTPLTEAILFDQLSQSGDPVARSNADIMVALQEIRDRIDGLTQRVDVRGENVTINSPPLNIIARDRAVSRLAERLASFPPKIIDSYLWELDKLEAIGFELTPFTGKDHWAKRFGSIRWDEGAETSEGAPETTG